MSTMLKNLARTVIAACAEAYGFPAHGQAMSNAQMYCLGEEAGEALGAWRRWNGWARRNGTQEAFEQEMADVVIAAYCVAEAVGFDLDEAIHRKAQIVLTRGWKEPEQVLVEPRKCDYCGLNVGAWAGPCPDDPAGKGGHFAVPGEGYG